MKRIILTSFLLSSLSIVIFTGCKKSSQPVTRTSLLTKDTWKFSGATASGLDVSSQIPVCYKDNIIDFMSNGTGTIDEAANVCSPSTATTFGWNFETNETILSMTTNIIPGGTGDFAIDELTETTLKLSQETSLIPAPSPLTIVVTFVHP